MILIALVSVNVIHPGWYVIPFVNSKGAAAGFSAQGHAQAQPQLQNQNQNMNPNMNAQEKYSAQPYQGSRV